MKVGVAYINLATYIEAFKKELAWAIDKQF